MVTSRLVTGGDAIQETVTFSLVLVNRSRQTCIRCFLYSCLSIRGAHLAQTLRYSSVTTIVSSALKPIFSSVYSRNPPIRADEPIETLFISWCDSCAWPSGTWRVLHVAVAAAETRHPPPHCANIYCLVSASVGECHWVQFFPRGGIQLHTFASYALPCQTPFCHTAPLLSSVAWQPNITEYGGKVQSLLPYHQHPPLTFGATFVDVFVTFILRDLRFTRQ